MRKMLAGSGFLGLQYHTHRMLLFIDKLRISLRSFSSLSGWPMLILEKSGWAGLSNRLRSAGITALGAASTQHLASRSH